MNAESPLVVRSTRSVRVRASAIIHLMERAAAEKPKIVELADRIATYFVAALLLVSVAVAIGWYLGSIRRRRCGITVSVLVVTCLTLLVVGDADCADRLGGARPGWFLRPAGMPSKPGAFSPFCFDKTGTLTTGRMHLVDAHRRLSR